MFPLQELSFFSTSSMCLNTYSSHSLFYTVQLQIQRTDKEHTSIMEGKREKTYTRLTRCRWCVEGDLRAVGAEHRVPAASDPEGVQAVRLQVTHHSAGAIHPVCSPPDPTVLTILLGRGLARAPESGEKEYYSQVILIFPHPK